MDVREDLIYGVSWSPRPKRSIFKVKRALELVNPIHSRFSCAISLPSFLVIQNSKIIFTKNMHGHPLICYLWIQFFTTFKMTYYQGQMSPRAGNPPILSIFVCHSLPFVLVIQNSDIIFVKIFHGRLLDLIYRVSRSPWSKGPIFKVKRAQSR